MKKWAWLAVVIAALFTGYAVAYALKPAVPNVNGYLDGKDILFQHTEVSDAKVAELLTEMMKSPVLVVPTLARRHRASWRTSTSSRTACAVVGRSSTSPMSSTTPPAATGTARCARSTS